MSRNRKVPGIVLRGGSYRIQFSRQQLLVVLVAGVFLAGTVLGQQVVRSSLDGDGAAPELRVTEEVLSLSLEDAIAVALEQNLGLRTERYQRARVFYGIEQNLGIFDLELSATSSLTDDSAPAASALQGADVETSESRSINLGLSQLLRFGGTAALDWRNGRFETNNSFFGVNPRYTVSLDAVYSQPLLSGRGTQTTTRGIVVARTNSSISLNTLEQAVTNTVQQVENAYWSLVETQEQLRVAEESLALAKELHEMNQVQVEVGTMAPLELIQSEVGIATRQEDIIRAQASVEDAADELRRLLNLDRQQYWGVPIEPATEPETPRIDVDLDQAIELALAERPDVRNQRLQISTLELDAAVQRNLKQPRLDLQVRYGYSGLGGTVLVRDPGASPFDPDAPVTLIPGGYEDAFEQVLDRDFKGWSVNLNFGYPLQNREAEARSVIANLALEQGKTTLEDLELGIRTEVRAAVRAVNTAAQQIDAARVSVRFNERNVEAEQKRYENGLATSFEILQKQEELTLARSREVSAVTGYRRALANYYRSIGRLLEEKGIELEDDLAESHGE